MKAILVLDKMPKSCANCRLKRGLFCGENGNSLYDYIHYNDKPSDKPDWCPLRPLPERKPKDNSNEVNLGFELGWNACLDEILGETE